MSGVDESLVHHDLLLAALPDGTDLALGNETMRASPDVLVGDSLVLHYTTVALNTSKSSLDSVLLEEETARAEALAEALALVGVAAVLFEALVLIDNEGIVGCLNVFAMCLVVVDTASDGAVRSGSRSRSRSRGRSRSRSGNGGGSRGRVGGGVRSRVGGRV